MVVGYEVVFDYKNSERDRSIVTKEKILEIEKICKDFEWNQSEQLSQEIGERLFDILNCDERLVCALANAAECEECQILIRTKGRVSDLPFELLYQSGFLIPSRIHIVRQVSDRGSKKELHSKNRPLKILFMACSPEHLFP